MSRKPTPEPDESRMIGGGGVVAFLWSLLCVSLWWGFGHWFLLLGVLLLLFPAMYFWWLLYRVSLLLAAWWRWRGTGIEGILVYSDSPHSKPYIEENWLAHLEGRVVILNWSARRKWAETLPVRVFRRFGIGPDYHNFNPMVILLKGLRHPLTYRFYYAFQDAKHGRPESLKRLEGQMFAEFERRGVRPSGGGETGAASRT